MNNKKEKIAKILNEFEDTCHNSYDLKCILERYL